MRASPRLLASFLPLALAGAATGPSLARADGPTSAPPAAVPADWVAQCFGTQPRTLTLRGLAMSLVQAARQELMEPGSGELTTLKQMTEERVVLQEARALGIAVTPADIDKRSQELDGEVRTKTNGKQTLRDVVYKDMHSNLPEFRLGLRHLMLKEQIAAHTKYLGPGLWKQPSDRRLAQVQVVVTELLKKAKIDYGIPNALQPVASTLAAGVVATVNGEPITTQEFGTDLARRLPPDDVRRVIDQECKAVLTEAMALTEQEMVVTIEEERAKWNKWREMSSQEAWRAVSFDDFVKAQYHVSLEDLKKNRYFRGRYGLEKSIEGQVTADDARKEFESKKDGLYGESIRAIDVNIGFVQENQLVQAAGARERKAALRAANEILVQKESGTPFDQIVRSVNAKQDRSFTASGRRLRNVNDDRILYERAKAMRDGEVVVVETLSAVHVLRREGHEDAPTFDKVQEIIQQGLVRQRADAWLLQRMGDEKAVKVRWPLPEDVWGAAINAPR